MQYISRYSKSLDVKSFGDYWVCLTFIICYACFAIDLFIVRKELSIFYYVKLLYLQKKKVLPLKIWNCYA